MTRSSDQIAGRLLPLCLVIACQGETTTPTAVPASLGAAAAVTDNVVSKVTVIPDSQMVFAGDQFQVIAQPKNKAGEVLDRSVSWTVNNTKVVTAVGSPNPTMTFKAVKVGTTAVKATVDGKSKASRVVVRGVASAKVVVTPAAATVASGATVQFLATGLTKDGETARVNVTWTATGGAISQGGVLTAGSAPGTYRVIATSAFGAADTAIVTIGAAGAAPIDRVVLLPDIAASRPGEKTQFVASVWNTLGASVPDPVTYQATCGTVTGAGAFNAPQDETGSCLVTATVAGVADTTEVVLLPNTPGQGVPFGINDLWASATTTRATGTAPFTASREYFPAADMVSHIQAARARGVHLLLVMTGASHDRYKTNGVFDQAKWEAAMNAFDTPAIRDAVAQGVADSTIIGNSVMDEPQQSGTTVKDWGPPGTMTKLRVDGLCSYVKGIFPTLPVGVGHDHSAFEPGNSYQVCEFLMPQYALRKGNVAAWRDAGLALAARDGMAIIFSMNLLDGGAQDKSGAWDCPGTGGVGTHSPNCRVTPAQLRDWGKLLGQAGCALLSWRYDASFMAKPENQAAISDVAITLSSLPRTPCSAR